VPGGAPVLFQVHVLEPEYDFCTIQVFVPAHRATNLNCGLALGHVAVAVTVIVVPWTEGDGGAAEMDTAVHWLVTV